MMYGMKLVVLPSFSMRVLNPSFYRTAKYVPSNTEIILPPKPKRPLSTYLSFYKENFQKVRMANPKLQMPDIAKSIALIWAQEDKRAKTDRMTTYQESMAKYYEEKEKYLASLTPEQLSVITKENIEIQARKDGAKIRMAQKEHNMPKKPATSFGKFLKDTLKARGIKGSTTTTKEIAKEWTKMDDVTKKLYAVEFKKRRAEYFLEIARWEEEMVRLGKEELIRPKSQVDEQKYKKKVPTIKS